MNKKYLFPIIMLTAYLLTFQNVLSYDAEFHPVITKEAVSKSKKLAGTDDYLKKELGFKNGLNEKFTGPAFALLHQLTVREWIEQGSRWEDIKLVDGQIRATRHFYDPTKPKVNGRLTDPKDYEDPSALQWAWMRDSPDCNDPYSWTDCPRILLFSSNKRI